MPTNPTPPLPTNSTAVGNKTKRINFQSGDKTELENFQRNVADQMDKVLSFINQSFSVSSATKTSGTAALQSGSSQQASNAKPNNITFKGQPTKTYLAPLIEAFSPANALSTGTVFLQAYKPAGSTVAPTLLNVRRAVPFAGSVIGFDIYQYNGDATAGTYQVVLYNKTQNAKTTALAPSKAYSQQGYFDAATPIAFNKGDILVAQLSVSGWAQPTTGGVEVRLWAQT